ncbi:MULTISPECIES: ATP-binding protein [Marinobacter]|uniref:histidine kinase n=1 Tax=Marinobacter metalliresistant TaxID=2961995 RepID=A0ABZ2W786_9GAMM|nr:ATP-binding protein [Marinobacter sp. Arc7-DN-1]AXS82920.1 GHKL domain-containing protein [Marinobacter sp. Arc7-DN-1]
MTDQEQMSSEDDGAVSLRPKARILKTLGEELISSETVALIELVKNAYDADAQNVLISFSEGLMEGRGFIRVMDDGHGMDMKTIRNSWMVIATSTKKNNKISKSGKRRVLGEKGIGRFATARIAQELELVTRTADQPTTESYAVFDWTQFENDDLFLDDILFLADEQEANAIVPGWRLENFADEAYEVPYHGTILTMNRLKHTWEKSDLENLQRGLSRLLSPFYSESDFNIFMELPEEHSEFSSRISPPEIINYPHYIVQGKIKGSGEYSFSVRIQEEGKDHNFSGFLYKTFSRGEWMLHTSSQEFELTIENQKERSVECGPFDFELRIWDRDELENVDQKVGGGVRSIRKDLNAIAGINIYRDGFRVLPYGEPDNDWLRLDLRRVQSPTKRLSNNQITGYIAITADKNPQLHDRSNREGLDNNQAYFDLQDIMKFILNETENLRYSFKRKKPNEKNNGEQKGLFDSPDFSELAKAVSGDDINKESTLKLINKAEDDWKKQIKKLQGVLSQYHALATLGGIVDKILHDGRQPLAKIQTEAGLGQEIAEDLVSEIPESAQLKELEKSFFKIVSQSSILRDVFRRAEPFGGRKRGRPKKYYIEDLVNEIFSLYSKEFDDASIIADIPSTQTLVSIDTTELSEIFTNLITNSIYWLKSVPKESRRIHVMIERRKDSSLEIIFSDTGPGIDQKYKDLIFEPYFSRKPDGHGLGLCLVGEIVHDYYNGTVELLDTGSSGGTAFRIIINKRV